MSFGVSVIIPAYNAANWLQSTVDHIAASLKAARIKKAEVIIVNDGSADNTLVVAKKLQCEYPVQVIDQENKGRFLARKAGLLRAKHENVLFIDSRVYLHQDSLRFLAEEIARDPGKKVWNGHVHVKKNGNIIARFGDAITYIGWRRYFSNPRTCSYGLEDFDHYPKGTGCFFAPKNVLLSAAETFESQTYDIKNSSDDTHLIRLIAHGHRIHLSPNFACNYHARNRIGQFIRHSYFRGQYFVDGFLRPGNRFFLPLLMFLVGLPLVLFVIVLEPSWLMPLSLLIIALWLSELGMAMVLGVSPKDALSLFLLSPIFVITYGTGIWVAVIRKGLHKFH